MISLAALAILAGFSLNLLLFFALGSVSASGDPLYKGEVIQRLPVFQICILGIVVLLLWIVFAFLVPYSAREFSLYFLMFPSSVLACSGLEFLGKKLFPSGSSFRSGLPSPDVRTSFSAYTAYDGLVPAAFVLTHILAKNFIEAFVVVASFTVSTFAAMLILNEIRRRSSLERVPYYVRGTPLILISMGLLSFVLASVSGIFLAILEVFP